MSNDRDGLATLRYIADSPPRDCGGFDPRVVGAVQAGLAEIARLRACIADLQAGQGLLTEGSE